LFFLAALSTTWAQCLNFTIYANNSSIGCGDTPIVEVTTMYGESFILRIFPEDESISWTGGGYTFSTSAVFEPIFENPTGASQTLTYTVTRNNVSKDIAVTLNQRPSYTVSFSTSGGAPIPPLQQVLKDSLATEPVGAFTRAGYNFDGWDFNFNTPITADRTINAKWKAIEYDITYHQNGGTGVSNRKYTIETPTITLPAPTRTGYTFAGWYDNAGFAGNTITEISTGSTGNKNFYAKWEIQTYNITYHQNGGAGATDGTYTIETPTITLPIPTRTGYDFKGWHDNAGFTGNPITTIPTGSTGDKTFHAKWDIKTYTVQFSTGGGSAVPNQTVNHESQATVPTPNPTRTGYDFKDWDFDFSTKITANITINAIWIPKTFTVMFTTESETFDTQLVEYNARATAPDPPPTRENYVFDYWELSGAQYHFTPITSNITLTAKWKPKPFTINFNAQGGTVNPASKTVLYGEPVGQLPTPTKYAFEFKGWFTEEDGDGIKYEASTLYTDPSTTILYAHWDFIKGTVPTASMLNYPTLSGLVYNSQPISPVIVQQRENVFGTLGTITTLYNGSPNLPKDAGIYTLSVSIAASEDYASATISLFNFIIGKSNVVITVISAKAENKEYNADRAAIISNVVFDESSLFLGDNVSSSDYSINANFFSQNVGEDIEVNGVVHWLSNGPLSQNYMIESTAFTTSANITRATGFLMINAPEKYELSNPVKPSILHKNSFVKDEDIIWEYKREEDAEFSTNLPNRVGNWIVRATLEETENYTGAVDQATFPVSRGDATTVIHNIEFEETGLTRDAALSGTLRHYFVASAELCNIEDVTIQITVVEPDIVLSLGSIPQKGEPDKDGFIYYELPFSFGKPGVDTLFYSLLSRDGIYVENDTILIETPVPFENVSGQKWNNVLFINNNPQTNGGYDFSEFKWFKNGSAVSEMQFYSAGPSSTDVLNPNDVFTVTMHTTDGMRISTCKGSSKKETETASKSAYTKQVLGVNGKTANHNAKIYNSKGERSKGTAAGVYIIKRMEN
jgi:uncharacterized repeat protein (TIGR02543 family)